MTTAQINLLVWGCIEVQIVIIVKHSLKLLELQTHSISTTTTIKTTTTTATTATTNNLKRSTKTVVYLDVKRRFSKLQVCRLSSHTYY